MHLTLEFCRITSIDSSAFNVPNTMKNKLDVMSKKEIAIKHNRMIIDLLQQCFEFVLTLNLSPDKNPTFPAPRHLKIISIIPHKIKKKLTVNEIYPAFSLTNIFNMHKLIMIERLINEIEFALTPNMYDFC